MRAAQKAPHSAHRLIVETKVKGPSLAPPTADGVEEPLLQGTTYVQKRWRPRPAVEIFVSTANRQIRAGAVQIDRHRTNRMAQIPQSQRASLVGSSCYCSHVVQETTLKDDVGQRQQRSVAAQPRLDGFLGTMDSVGRGNDLDPVPATQQISNAL